MPDMEVILVFDVGGSHVSAAAFDIKRRSLGKVSTCVISNDVFADEILDVFDFLRQNITHNLRAPDGVAVAMPSPFDYDRGISYMQHKYRNIYGMNLRDRLAERLRCDASCVHFVNDAAAFLIGEITHGAAQNVGRSVGITLGTGVGSAFAIDGEIVVHGTGVPASGEIWNLTCPGGTIEDLVSTRAIQRLYEEQGGKHEDVREISRLSSEQASARQAFEGFGRQLGTALQLTCREFAPERIVLGGGIARAAHLFVPAAKAALGRLAAALRISELDHRAPLIGAGVSWGEGEPWTQPIRHQAETP